MLLVCNAPDSVQQALEGWQPATDPVRTGRVQKLLPTMPAPNLAAEEYGAALANVVALAA